jgi:hypothetical protein
VSTEESAQAEDTKTEKPANTAAAMKRTPSRLLALESEDLAIFAANF